MEAYLHKIQYYETDKMGITHHSNYIRWMEEARVDFFAQIGWDYARLEEMGIFSPVTAVACDYQKTTTFPDTVRICITVEEFKGVRLKLGYQMYDQMGQPVCRAKSEHCFLNRAGRPIRMRQEQPALFAALAALTAGEAGNSKGDLPPRQAE